MSFYGGVERPYTPLHPNTQEHLSPNPNTQEHLSPNPIETPNRNVHTNK